MVTFHGRVTTDTTTPPITRSRVHWNAIEQNRFVESVVTKLEECYLELSQLLDLKSTCDVNLLSKLSIIFKEWRVVNNMYRGGARV